MENQFIRTELIFGEVGLERLSRSRVAVFGLGGVGGYVVEALARSGVGALDLVDNDTVCLSNLNRQIIATHRSIGRFKVDAAEERVHDINPFAVVRKHRCFYMPETADQFDFTQYDYVVDAIDTVKGKLELVQQAHRAGVPIICSMGAGNKVDPSALRVADIYETRVCPLARVMRSQLRKLGIQSLKVVYSEEPPITPRPEVARICREAAAGQSVRRDIPGSTAFVPPVAGLILAGEVVKDLTGFTRQP